LKDRITSASECEAKADNLSRSGGEVEFVGLAGAGHWFDNHTDRKFDRTATRKVTKIIDKMLFVAIDSSDQLEDLGGNGDLMDLFDDVRN
jgi:hypothetical protein